MKRLSVIVLLVVVVVLLNACASGNAIRPVKKMEPRVICGDGLCNGGETCSSCPKDCECAKADLLVADVRVVDNDGTTLGFNFDISNIPYHPLPTVKNIGKDSVDVSSFKYAVGHTGNSGQYNAIGWCKRDPTTLLPGESVECDTANAGGFGESPGKHEIAIFVDYGETVDELNEDNNMLIKKLILTDFCGNGVCGPSEGCDDSNYCAPDCYCFPVNNTNGSVVNNTVNNTVNWTVNDTGNWTFNESVNWT